MSVRRRAVNVNSRKRLYSETLAPDSPAPLEPDTKHPRPVNFTPDDDYMSYCYDFGGIAGTSERVGGRATKRKFDDFSPHNSPLFSLHDAPNAASCTPYSYYSHFPSMKRRKGERGALIVDDEAPHPSSQSSFNSEKFAPSAPHKRYHDDSHSPSPSASHRDKRHRYRQRSPSPLSCDPFFARY